MQATSLNYTPLAGGPRTGLLALEVQLGQGREFRPAQLAREIEMAAERVSARPRIVSIEIANVADAPDADMEIFLRLLRDKGFALHLTVMGVLFRPWFDLCTYKIAEITREPWPCWTAQEIRFLPEEGKYEEPEIGQNNAGASKYLVASRGLTIASLLAFHQGAKHQWGVIQEPLKHYVLQFFGPGGKE
jgi:hypothetical protein